MAPLQTCTIGYPRIGGHREMKKVLERYWKQAASLDELLTTASEVNCQAWKAQKDAGIDLVGLDGTLYDQVLDMIATLGLIPQRFNSVTGHDLYFAMARGIEGAPALDMSKYFNTNYHFLVPEVSASTVPALNDEVLMTKVKAGQAAIGRDSAIPMIIGPVTMARLANLDGITIPALVAKLVPVYQQLIANLGQLQVPEIQILEPALCYGDDSLREVYESAYKQLTGMVPLNLVTFYDDLGSSYAWAVQLPVAAISLDFVGVSGAKVACSTLDLIQKHGFPADKRLGAGVIDGRNVWADASKAGAIVEQLKSVGISNICVQPSCSLQHVPIDLQLETKLEPAVKSKLAFAVQKLAELTQVAGNAPSAGVASAAASQAKAPQPPPVEWFSRSLPYNERRAAQHAAHPKTASVRKARSDLKAGRITEDEYHRQMETYLAHAIGVQEGLGLDVLVHGEPERSDMVEFFGVSMTGLAFTEHAWVQSYGSRYVRPPIIHGDVSRPSAMTLREFSYAQSLTTAPVKGMLTGPVTMIQWSFVRIDVPRSTTAFQIALALRDEVADLEAAGCNIIQVDEPALREGLPLKKDQWDGYLEWAVDAFRLTCSVAKPATQIVTHLCYSDFGDVLPAIDRMDADVLTIENSRSGNEMMEFLKAGKYSRDLGPGVYDVHSPVVPSVDFLVDKISGFYGTGILDSNAYHIWVNPDCGLKTRQWSEVVPSLKNMVEAARVCRTKFGVAGKAELSGSTFAPRTCAC